MEQSPRQLPTGTVTFFFSDVQDSTGLLQRRASDFKDLIERHGAIIRDRLSAHGGIEVRTEGDSFFAVFERAVDAVASAEEIQRRLADETWPEGGIIEVRIGLHAGVGELGFGDYVGLDVHRAARISAAGHGGQVVVSEAVRVMTPERTFIDLGEHVLRGIEQPERLYQLDLPGLPQTFPPLRTASARPNNLPTLASHIIGRDRERATLEQLIAENRLVTVTGPGGIGKTRLALEVANGVLSRFELGVFFVDLTAIDDPELLLTAITTAAGVEPNGPDGLAQALSDGPRLLVLDNFEQLATAAPRLATLMTAAPPLKVVATSQVPLRIVGEKLMRLDPLGASRSDAPAVELFVERALQADPGFVLDAHREHVLRLVEALDGVPLAIELAAARVNVLTPSQILDRLGSGVLKTTRVDSPERHRSLAAAVEWSYDLLTSEQQELFGALSVFRGGASLESIESVVDRDPLDDLGELVDRSLVQTKTSKVGKRFDMLTSVQLFAATRVPGTSPYFDRHTDHFTRFAIGARGPLDEDVAPRWMARLEDDIGNLRMTLERLIEAADIQCGYALLGGTWRFFQATGRLDELELWLERVFTADESSEATPERARGLMARAALRYWRNDWQGSAEDYEEALAIAEAGEDPVLVMDALGGVLATRANAFVSGFDVGDYREALDRVRSMAQEQGDLIQQGYADFYDAITTAAAAPGSGAPDPDILDRAVVPFRNAGRRMNVAHVRTAQSEIYIAREEYSAARDAAADGLTNAEETGDVFTMSWALYRLATSIIELGEPELGTRVAGAADAARERSGGRFPPPFVPIDGALDRARATLGDSADELWHEGRAIPLFAAMSMARESIG
jgi:predicted ATPase/class 3 adenylate cyclase